MAQTNSYTCRFCKTVVSIDIEGKPERFKITCKNEHCKQSFVVERDKPNDPAKSTHAIYRQDK